MGMLSLAGIVSGAGAGAGKSLRQAQTYLNWEMLQEERGKLELARDERITERNIAQLKEQRAFNRSEDDRAKAEYYSPEAIAKDINRERQLASGKQSLWLEGKYFRGQQRLEDRENKLNQVESDQEIALARIQGPWAEKLRKAFRDIKEQEQTEDFQDKGRMAQLINDNPDMMKSIRNATKASYTELEEFNVATAKWTSEHRDPIYDGSLNDKSISHLQLTSTYLEKYIVSEEKLLANTVDPQQQEAIKAHLVQLHRKEARVTGKMFRLLTGEDLPDFEMPKGKLETKKTSRPPLLSASGEARPGQGMLTFPYRFDAPPSPGDKEDPFPPEWTGRK